MFLLGTAVRLLPVPDKGFSHTPQNVAAGLGALIPPPTPTPPAPLDEFCLVCASVSPAVKKKGGGSALLPAAHMWLDLKDFWEMNGKGLRMKYQMCWEALESLPPNISLKASAIFRALALKAMLSVEVGGGFPSEISSGLAPLLSWRAGSFLRETGSPPGCQLDRQQAHSSNWDPHSHREDIPPLWGHCWRGQQSPPPQADLPPPEQRDRQTNSCFAHLCF